MMSAILVLSFMLVFWCQILESSPAVGVVGGMVNMNMTISDRAVNTSRNVVDPNNVIIVDFTSGMANPVYTATDVAYTGNISNGFVSFTLSNLRTQSAGIYKYIISKRIENMIAGVQYLVIAESPSTPIISELSQQAVAGREYKLNCSAVSRSEKPGHNLTMFSEWKRNGVNIMADTKYGINGTILTIRNLSRTDNTVSLTCIAFEDQRMKSPESIAFSLNVYYGPESITLSPSQMAYDLLEYSSLNVNCSADCVPSCQYRWTGPGGNYPDKTGILSISKISRSQAGVFTCTAYNPIITSNSATATVSVTVQCSPAVGVVGGMVNMNMTISDRDINTSRNLVDPNNVIILDFVYGMANPAYTDSDVTYTGNILDGFVSFTLSNLRTQSAGIYQYIVSKGAVGNVLAGEKCLVIAESPSTPIISGLSQQAVAGREYKLNCSAVSRSEKPGHNLTMFSEWKRNGVNIMADAKYGVNGTILTIRNLSRNDNSASLTCIAFEDQRMKSPGSIAFPLNVYYGPDNTQISPSDQLSVDEGRLLNITCSGECNPPCSSYQWYKDSQLTLLGSSQALAITNVSRNSAGVYSCTVNNTYIAKVATAQINVKVNYGPDHITLSPSRMAYMHVENSSLNVNCSADCVPSCQYRWTGPGVSYPDNTGILSISKISRSQAGVITCTAYNPIITSNSATATVSVTVQYGPDNPILYPDNKVYTVNESSVPPDIRCSADCFPSCTSRWYKDQKVVYGNPSYLLSLGNVYRNATGTYSCRSENMETNATAEKAIQLVVQYSPTVDIESRNGSHNDTSLMIKCSAHGIPEQYTYRLTHKSLSSGIEIREVSYEFISTGVIIHRFINPTYMDTGIYTCSVNNGILDYTDGSLDKSIYSTVWIKGLPYITSRETSFYAEVGHSGRLIIELYNSLLDLVVTWYKHNGGALEKLLNSDKYNIIIASSMVDVNFYSVRIHEPGVIATLVIRNITEEDFSLYQVHVQNSVGEIHPLLLQLRVSGSTPQEKIDSGPVIIGSTIGSTLFVSLIVTAIGILLYRKRNAHDKGNRVKGENTPRSLDTSTEKVENPQSIEKQDQYLELQHINGEDGENLNVRSSRTVLYETIHSNPNDQEHVYHDLSSGERIAYENTNFL